MDSVEDLSEDVGAALGENSDGFIGLLLQTLVEEFCAATEGPTAVMPYVLERL